MSQAQIELLLTTYSEALGSYQYLESLFNNDSIATKYILDEFYKCKLKLLKVIELENEGSYNLDLFKLKEQMEIQIRKMETIFLAKKTDYHNAESAIHTITNNENNYFEANLGEVVVNPSNSHQTGVKRTWEGKEKFNETIESMKVEPCVKGLDDIAGLKEVKRMLKTLFILPLYQPQLYEGRNRTNCILLFGPPGTGKTRLVHALAAESKASLHCISASDVLGKYVGQTEKMLKEVFNFAQNSEESIILFIDEVDGLCQKRSDDEKQYSRRLKTELMCQLTHFENYKNALLICATNCPWDLDVAFIRRFQKRIHVPLPNRSERRDIVTFFTRKTKLESTSQFWEAILDRTEGYSGSDLANVVTHALNIPIYELEDAKIWRVIENKRYMPIGKNQFSEHIVCCSVDELPSGSVVARDVEFLDLFTASEQVTRTVCEETVKRYEKYVFNC